MNAISKIDVSGTELAYQRQGEGTPVLLIHGSGSDMRCWEAQIATLSRSHTVIAYSRRFHRPNPRITPGADYPFMLQVEDAAATIEGLGLGPVHLVGHSYGGAIALMLAVRRPDLIRSLTLEEPAVFNIFVQTPPRLGEILAMLIRHPKLTMAFMKFGGKVYAPAQKAALAGDLTRTYEIFANGVIGEERLRMLSPERVAQSEENRCPEELTGSGFTKIGPAAVKALKMPVQVVSGTDSPAIWPILADVVAKMIPGAGRVRIADAGHLVHEDQPAAYDAALLEFLARVDRAA